MSWSRSRLKKKSGAGAGKKFAGSPALAVIVYSGLVIDSAKVSLKQV